MGLVKLEVVRRAVAQVNTWQNRYVPLYTFAFFSRYSTFLTSLSAERWYSNSTLPDIVCMNTKIIQRKKICNFSIMSKIHKLILLWQMLLPENSAQISLAIENPCMVKTFWCYDVKNEKLAVARNPIQGFWLVLPMLYSPQSLLYAVQRWYW